MNAPLDIAIANYDYPLPNNRIAKFPLPQRDASKLLYYKHGTIAEYSFSDLPLLIEEGSLMLFNDTKVIHARILFQKTTGATIEIFCLEPYQTTAVQSFAERQQTSWLCLVGNNKKWKDGVLTKKILIAEDEELNIAFLREVLADTGAITIWAQNGKDAVEIAQKTPDLDMILMDVKMPVMNGYDATKKIREFNQKVIIIAQTAYALSGEKEKSIAAGCNYYLTKPIDVQTLINTINGFINNK